jgi:hypothetical protein
VEVDQHRAGCSRDLGDRGVVGGDGRVELLRGREPFPAGAQGGDLAGRGGLDAGTVRGQVVEGRRVRHQDEGGPAPPEALEQGAQVAPVGVDGHAGTQVVDVEPHGRHERLEPDGLG